MKIVKNIIATLLGIGVIFVGGETVGLRTRATSIEAPVPVASIVATTTGVSGDETTTTTDTTTTTETERPTALGEGVTDIVTTESPTNSGTDAPTHSTSIKISLSLDAFPLHCSVKCPLPTGFPH